MVLRPLTVAIALASFLSTITSATASYGTFSKPLFAAIEAQNHTLAAALLTVFPPMTKAIDYTTKYTTVYASVVHKDAGILQLLLEHGGDVNAAISTPTTASSFFGLASSYGDTPLCRAVHDGLTIIIEILLQANATVDAPCGNAHGTALIQACRNDSTAFAHLLLQAGADPNLPLAMPPLLVALNRNYGNSSSDYALLKTLLEAGANASLPLDSPPLLLAVKEGNLMLVELLLAHHANPNPTYVGKQPLIVAMEKEDMASADELLCHGATLKDVPNAMYLLVAAVERDDLRTAEFLLKAGVDLNLSVTFPSLGVAVNQDGLTVNLLYNEAAAGVLMPLGDQQSDYQWSGHCRAASLPRCHSEGCPRGHFPPRPGCDAR